jgi:hypothetical protein
LAKLRDLPVSYPALMHMLRKNERAPSNLSIP